MTTIKKLKPTDIGKKIIANVVKANNNLIITNSNQFYKNVLKNHGFIYNDYKLFQVVRLTVDYLRFQIFDSLNLTYKEYQEKYRFQINQIQFDNRIGLFYFKKFSNVKKLNLNLSDWEILNILKLCYKSNNGKKSFV